VVYFFNKSTAERLPGKRPGARVEKIQPGLDGLILQKDGKRATFLPSVWEKIPHKENFISQLRRKAGLDPQGWSANTQVFYYRSIEFS